VYFYVNDRFYAGPANGARSDVNAVMGIAGRHGFSVSVPLRSGPNVVCVYAIGVDVTAHTLLGCPTVQGPAAGPPIGYLDSMTVSGSIVTIKGWALDPTDSGTSTPVHLYLNFRGPGVVTANLPRRDVNTALQVAGDHGFSAQLGLDPGVNTICVYAIGADPNVHTDLGCLLAQPAAVQGLARTLAAPNAAGAAPDTVASEPAVTAPTAPTPAAQSPTPVAAPSATPASPASPAPAPASPLASTPPPVVTPASTATSPPTSAPAPPAGSSALGG
jgi:hypothetical protein